MDCWREIWMVERNMSGWREIWVGGEKYEWVDRNMGQQIEIVQRELFEYRLILYGKRANLTSVSDYVVASPVY